MVNNDTDLMSSHQKPIEPRQALNVARWLRNFVYLPWHTRRCFDATVRTQISQAVQRAEQHHAGEIQVIIEGHLPLNLALRADTRLRAQQLFAEYGVWDTAHNSGVLLYINLCERQVEILADRGISSVITAEQWHQLCNQIIDLLKQQHYQQAVITGIELIGQILDQFYAQQTHDIGNELPNNAIFL